MGGAIIQLVAYGSPNIYLTGDPQITFFKSVYKRYTNFSTESIQQDIIGNLSPGNFISIIIGRNGDLLKGLTLEYNPSTIYKNLILYTNGFVPSNLGHTIFKQIEIEIGGNLIDRHYGLWLTIWSDLTIQSYIAPSTPVDTNIPYIIQTGVEPDISNQYARMSYNHNQLNTYLDYQFRSACLYSDPDSEKFNGTLAYHLNSPTTIPVLPGTFDLQIDNINELITFDNPLNVIYLFKGNSIPSASSTDNYFLHFSSLNTTSGVTTFSNCQPYSPSIYSTSAVPIDTTNYSICNVFDIYTGLLNPYDFSPPGITNIIPDSTTTSFNIRINNPTNINFYNTKGTLTVYSGTTGEYYNIEYGSPTGKNKFFVTEGYLVIYDCQVLNPPAVQEVLVSTDLVVPTGTYYGALINNLLYITKLINVLPTSGTVTGIFSSPFDVFTEFGLSGPLPTLLLLIRLYLNDVTYDIVALPFIGTTIYNPITQLFYYVTTDGVFLNSPPSVVTEIPDGTIAKSQSYISLINGAPSQAYVPLQFWFCRNPGLALPLIALQYHEVKLKLLLASWQELHASRYADIDLSSIKVYAEYVYLDSIERRQFANNAHEYLIEQLQFDTFNNSFENNLSGGQLAINLNFNNCVKEIVFCGTPVPYGINSQGIGTPNTILNTKAETSNVEMQLKINQAPRFSNRNLKYFTRNQIWDCHTGSGSCNGLDGEIGTDNIGVYSFSLRPQEHQPSGTCNFSRISKPQLVFSNFDSTLKEKLNSLNIYAVNYNIFRIMSGMGNIAYAY